jgi:nucleoside-diphosphate-sugar epimerase
MKVFITGATGYIGFNVALAFRRVGHEVWGLARSEEKGQLLVKNEIHPVIGTMQQPESYVPYAERCSVLIHAASDPRGDTVSLDRKTIEMLIDAGRREVRPKTIIYTSGVWVHGNTGPTMVDETFPLSPAKLVSWRPAIEETVLRTPGIKGIVIRPGCVYGKQGGLTGIWFSGAHKDKSLKVVGNGHNYWSIVHVDDLADGYRRAAESGLCGEVFNIVAHRITVAQMVSAVVRASGYAGNIQFISPAEASKKMGDFAECLALDQRVDGGKAMRLLGWLPRHQNFEDEIDTYFASWKAFQVS